MLTLNYENSVKFIKTKARTNIGGKINSIDEKCSQLI